MNIYAVSRPTRMYDVATHARSRQTKGFCGFCDELRQCSHFLTIDELLTIQYTIFSDNQLLCLLKNLLLTAYSHTRDTPGYHKFEDFNCKKCSESPKTMKIENMKYTQRK